MKKNEYQCYVCDGIFEKGWTEEEARAEQEKNGWKEVPCEMVCEDCYKIIMNTNGG